MSTTNLFKAYVAANTVITTSLGTLKAIASEVPGTVTKLNDSGKSLVIRRPDNTSMLVTLSAPLQEDVANPEFALSSLGGCEIHKITMDGEGTVLENPYYRLHRPVGGKGEIITEFTDYVKATSPIRVKRGAAASVPVTAATTA